MSLATRCTGCGTVFRIVQDQLKVSEGWVRCGQCSAVFNALEGLFDLERESPAESFEASSGARSAPEEAAPVADPSEPPVIADAGEVPDGPHAASGEVLDRAAAAATQEHPVQQVDIGPPGDADSMESAAASDAPEAPGFVRDARRRERWRSTPMRAAGTVVAVALAGLLGLQFVHHFRHSIAARWPAAQPVLTSWCAAVACSIDARKRIEDIAVESTALTRSVALPQAYQLAVVLRNRSAWPDAVPSVDLSLTDAQGRLVSRRMLSSSDFRASSAPLAPGAETSWQLLLSTGDERVAGYTVEVFYP